MKLPGILILYTDSPDDPQLRTILAQLKQVMKKPVTLQPLSKLNKKHKANVQPVLSTLTTIQPN